MMLGPRCSLHPNRPGRRRQKCCMTVAKSDAYLPDWCLMEHLVGQLEGSSVYQQEAE